MSTCCALLKTHAASLCSSAFKYQMQIQCLWQSRSSLAEVSPLIGIPSTIWLKDLVLWYFFFDCLCMCLPLLCMHKPLLGVFLGKGLQACIIVDVWVRAFITDVSFQGVCFLHSSKRLSWLQTSDKKKEKKKERWRLAEKWQMKYS